MYPYKKKEEKDVGKTKTDLYLESATIPIDNGGSFHLLNQIVSIMIYDSFSS